MRSRSTVLLGLLALGAIAGAVTSAAHAAGSDSTVMTMPQTGFDPFAIQTYAIEGESTGTATDMSTLIASRLPIRVPFRPPLRSPFRPDW